MSDYDKFVTIHPADSIVTVACAGCGKPISLTWTRSAAGERVYHGDCHRRWTIAARAREAALTRRGAA